MDKLTQVKTILKKYNQEHLLYFYDELSDEHKDMLLNQILNINFDEIISLYQNSLEPSHLDINTVSPLEHLEKNKFSFDELNKYIIVVDDVERCLLNVGSLFGFLNNLIRFRQHFLFSCLFYIESS